MFRVKGVADASTNVRDFRARKGLVTVMGRELQVGGRVLKSNLER